MGERIGFIGAGKMAQALASGMVSADAVNAKELCFHDPADAAASTFQSAVPQATRHSNNQAVVEDSEYVMLAVKPQVMPSVMKELQGRLRSDQTVISIAAGITIETISRCLEAARIIRVMPNTPCLIGQGAIGLVASDTVDDPTRQKLISCFSTVGEVVCVSESQIDALTGLSGSGPAYVLAFIEALADGGVLMGLPRDTALLLAAKTVSGAAQLMLETGQHPSVLRDQVTSPGGTTIAGLNALEKGAFRATVIQAVKSATERGRELAGG